MTILLQQRFSVEAAFELYSPKQSENKACKETIDNIDKLKESTSFLSTPLVPSVSTSQLDLRETD